MTARQCGDCQLCCKLLPMNSREDAQAKRTASEMIRHGLLSLRAVATMMKTFDKPAGQACPHQRHGKGCMIYDRRPLGCRVWNCRWLVNNDTADLRRPDRSRYVIDIMPDFVTLVDDETGTRANVEVVQIWCDPAAKEAWRDPALLAYLERRGRDGIAAIIRFSSSQAITVFPPSMSNDGEWHERHHGKIDRQRTPEERLAGVATAQKVRIG